MPNFSAKEDVPINWITINKLKPHYIRIYFLMFEGDHAIRINDLISQVTRERRK